MSPGRGPGSSRSAAKGGVAAGVSPNVRVCRRGRRGVRARRWRGRRRRSPPRPHVGVTSVDVSCALRFGRSAAVSVAPLVRARRSRARACRSWSPSTGKHPNARRRWRSRAGRRSHCACPPSKKVSHCSCRVGFVRSGAHRSTGTSCNVTTQSRRHRVRRPYFPPDRVFMHPPGTRPITVRLRGPQVAANGRWPRARTPGIWRVAIACGG